MATRTRRRGSADGPSVQLTFAALFLIVGLGWLLGLRADGPMYWVFAIGSLVAAAMWLVRGVRTLVGSSGRRARTGAKASDR